MAFEWKARRVWIRVVPSPARRSPASSSVIAASGPDRTTEPGASTATVTSPSPGSRGTTSSARAATLTMRPGSVSHIARARRCTRSAASCGDQTPASAAATYSPMLLPSIAAGRMFHARSWRPKA